MKYNVIELEPGKYAVGSGKKYYAATVSSDKALVEKVAAHKSAEWHMQKAQDLLEKMDWFDARNIGHKAIRMLNLVDEIVEKNDPEFNSSDPHAWRA